MSSFDGRRAWRALAVMFVWLLTVASAAQEPERTHTIAFFPSASDARRDGLARVINHSAEAGEVHIEAFDDEGELYGPAVLWLEADEAVNFNSDDLESGNVEKGLSDAVGPGQGAWRLELSSKLDIEVLSYLRIAGGFLTVMHDTVPGEDGGHRVAFFNPGSNLAKVSRLWLVNPGEEAAEVSIAGVDAQGESPGGEVTTTIAAGAARTFTAAELESGGDGLDGALGDGEGKWRLTVESAQPIVVMSLLSSFTGHLTNLSTEPANEAQGVHFVPLLPAASDASGRRGFVRVINRSDTAGEVGIEAFDDTGLDYEALTLSMDANESMQFSVYELEHGNEDKGLSGSTGEGQGAWRLELTSELDIRVLSYVHTPDGVIAAMHDTVPNDDGRHRVAFFNPASNRIKRSVLRLVNPGEEAAEVSIVGVDDRGESPGSEVRVTVASGASKTLSAQELEVGADGLDGALGDGEGKWQLTAESAQPIIVMSLLSNPVGHLSNLSTALSSSYRGRVTGHIGSFDEVEVLLSSRGVLRTTHPNSTGRFAFHELGAGEYAVKVRAGGYKTSPARIVRIPAGGKGKPFQLERLSTDPFVFHWEEDQSSAGYDYAAHVNQPPRIEFLGEPVDIADDSSSDRLRHDYNVLLVDSDAGSWSQEHAYRLLETMKAIPQERRDAYAAQTRPPSRWLLSAEYIEHDIEITRHEDGSRSVLVSEAAFVNASPRVASVDGNRGIWFSQRLHHAVVRYVTDNGRDEAAYEKILNERFGLTTRVDDYYALTAPTGHETAARFQPFHAEEIVALINMLEEIPRGMHKVPGFHTLVRRLDGTPHPLYPEAPAVAWPEQGYVEFMDSAFLSGSVQQMHRLIIHEKAHFLWAHLFDDRLKEDWIALGGWYRDASSPSGWYTSQQTEFASAYAHALNPNEDMAESIAFFIVNPDKLKSRAIDKYEFVRDRIMQGDIYISQIREDLTFEVYNLFPDYVFPGKIRRVDIRVEGAPEADKTISIEIELHALEVADDDVGTCQRRSAGHCMWARTRIFSDVGTYFDLHLHPPDASSDAPLRQDVVLRGSHILSKYAKAGYWLPGQIVIQDSAGNQRYERANDFGWKLYVNNPLEDISPPEYVAGTASLSLAASTLEVAADPPPQPWPPALRSALATGGTRGIQVIRATWRVEENAMQHPQGCYASMNDEISETYRIEEYGNYDRARGLCRVDFVMPDYMPSSTYSLDLIIMRDEARNRREVYFTGDFSRGEQHEEAQRIALVTANPDAEPPRVALDRLELDAEPTNPEAPNGETVVTVRARVRDDVSGFTHAALNFRDPQGIERFQWVYADDGYDLFARDDPTRWQWHTFTHILPPGSAPGIWGLADMTVYDRAGYFRGYDFTEIIHFQVE